MTASELIIDQPHLVRPGQKATALGVTLLFWGMLLYLWQPLISLVAWGFNIRLFHSHMIILGGYQALVDQLLPYALVIACLGTALLLWARLQQWRFSGEGRRRASPEVKPAAMAEHFGDRKSRRLSSSHVAISYAVFCLISKEGWCVDR